MCFSAQWYDLVYKLQSQDKHSKNLYESLRILEPSNGGGWTCRDPGPQNDATFEGSGFLGNDNSPTNIQEKKLGSQFFMTELILHFIKAMGRRMNEPLPTKNHES